MKLRPMLCATAPANLNNLTYPLLLSPKLDGIRCLVLPISWFKENVPYEAKHLPIVDKQRVSIAVSRTLKPIPNRYVQAMLDVPDLQWFDGELIVGEPTAPDCYRQTESLVMTQAGEPAFTYHVFDWFEAPNLPYFYGLTGRATHVLNLSTKNFPYIHTVNQTFIGNTSDLLQLEERAVSQGHEGVVLRSPQGLYKFGRSTLKQAYLIKLKRFVDDEAKIVDFQERMTNLNDASVSPTGYTVRSSHQENQAPTGTLGALICVTPDGVTFSIGTGFTEQERIHFWRIRADLRGCTVKYKHFPVGVKDKPRHPVFLGLRHDDDK